MKPLIVVNFKVYSESTGKNAVSLAQTCEKVHRETKVDIFVAPSLLDLQHVRSHIKIPVFSQHVDIQDHGAFTGHIPAALLHEHKIDGSLINHSERPLPLQQIVEAVQQAKKHKLKTIVCAPTITMIRDILLHCKPDYIAYEPPELIGGNTSVTDAEPDLIEEAAEACTVPLLCGAGIKKYSDVKKALELGCVGILVASGVVKASNPEKVLRELCVG